MEIRVEGLLGRMGRHCYAMVCLGFLILLVTIIHYYVSDEDDRQPNNPRENATSRLRAFHGPPLPQSQRNPNCVLNICITKIIILI